MTDNEPLMISGIQHFAFCRRQWALMHIEQQWADNTTSDDGRRRLRAVAKKCVAHGQRVQNSVFECLLDAAQLVLLKSELTAIIDPVKDSLRFYNLGNNYKTRIDHIGIKEDYDPSEVLIL